MIVKVKPLFKSEEGTKWETVISQGVQKFTITERYDKSECLWMARMFRKALKAHNEALLAKRGASE
jgi:hypothetical protein